MPRRQFLGMACLALLAGAPAAAAAAPAPAPPAAEQPDALKPVFEALPEADRRAVQDALIWTAGFNGAVTGLYGPRTHEALLAFAHRRNGSSATALDAASRALLLADAGAARRAVGFTALRDLRAGLSIGLPLKLLPLRTAIPDGSRYAAQDGTTVVDTAGRAAAGPDALTETFARLTRDAPGRRVTYRLAKPDFIVVAGESGDRRFYSRYALGTPPGAGPTLRGFTLAYAKASTDMDRIVLAVAASFDPFPPDATPASAAIAGVPPRLAATAAPVTPRPSAPTGVLTGEAVLVAPGLALTRLDRARCDDVAVGGAPARWSRQDPASGLALLAIPNGREAAAVALSPGGTEPRLALFLTPGETGAAPVLAVATAERDAAGQLRIPLQGADAGVVLIDAAGALSGLTEARGQAPVSVAGVRTAAAYGVADAQRISDFLRDAGVAVAPSPAAAMTAGEVVARWRPVLLPLRCGVNPIVSAAP